MELGDKNHQKLIRKIGRPLASEWLRRIIRADDPRLEEILMMTVNGLPDLRGDFSDYPDVAKDEENYRRILKAMRDRNVDSDFAERFSEFVARVGDSALIEKLMRFLENGDNFSDQIHRAKLKDLEGVNNFFGTHNPVGAKKLEFADEDERKEYLFAQSCKALGVPVPDWDKGANKILNFSDDIQEEIKREGTRAVNAFFRIGK